LLPTDDLSSWGAIAAHAANDFESVVLPRRPDIADVLARLGAASPLIARMSGSGATVFAILEDGAASPDPGDVADAHGSRPLSTWTAENVVPVEVIE
jgi:4-diphosphocytidyl-2C-methyl-D-erythritol kinase